MTAPQGWLDRCLVGFVFSLARTGQRLPGGGRPTGILHVFAFAEQLLEVGHVIRPLREGGVLRYEVTRLPSGTRPLPLDPPLQPGDPIIRIHLNNETVACLLDMGHNRRRLGWDVFRGAESDLTVLATMVQSGAFPPDIRAVWAETVMYRKLARIGMVTREAKPGLRRPFARLYALSLMAIYGSPGLIDRDADRLRHFQLGDGWIDMADLTRRYGKETPPGC
ncbi:MAG: YkoP family protein [Chloroflexota bacterium]